MLRGILWVMRICYHGDGDPPGTSIHATCVWHTVTSTINEIYTQRRLKQRSFLRACPYSCVIWSKSECVKKCVRCGSSGVDVLIHQRGALRSPSKRQGYSGPQGGEVSLLNRIYGLSLRHKLQSKYIMVLQDFPTATSLYWLRPSQRARAHTRPAPRRIHNRIRTACQQHIQSHYTEPRTPVQSRI